MLGKLNKYVFLITQSKRFVGHKPRKGIIDFMNLSQKQKEKVTEPDEEKIDDQGENVKLGEKKFKNRIKVPSDIARDLISFNLPRNVTMGQLKTQYHKLAKAYHPDSSIIKDKNSEEIFKEIQPMYERIREWIINRDNQFETALKDIGFNEDGKGQADYTIGKIKIRASATYSSKRQILDAMLEDQSLIRLREPKWFIYYLIAMWFVGGLYLFIRPTIRKFRRNIKPRPGYNYDKWFNPIKINPSTN